MPYHIEPAAVLEGEAAERFIDMIRAAQKGSIDFSEEKASAERILANSKASIFDTPCINCLTRDELAQYIKWRRVIEL